MAADRFALLTALFFAANITASNAAVWRVTPADDVEDIVENAEEGDSIILPKGSISSICC